jgi:dinuclear metal center YbgI/SA1388 family protein
MRYDREGDAMKTDDLGSMVDFLNGELKVSDFSDDSHNGLQVQNAGRIRRVCCGVDASLDFFEQAAARGANLLVCHHGLSWGDSLKRITDLNYRRLKFLIERDMALYACHLPLDAHPELGNNARICQALGLAERRPFGLYRGIQIGFRGTLPRAVSFRTFRRRAAALFQNEIRALDFGRSAVRTVAVVSGGAAAEIEEAGRLGVDVYVTGESTLAAYHLAREYGINAVFAGHYATEVFGVQALAALLAQRFSVPAEFLRLPTPY